MVYIKKFEELSRFRPHAISTNVLRVDRFLQRLRIKIYLNIKMKMNVLDIPYSLFFDSKKDLRGRGGYAKNFSSPIDVLRLCYAKKGYCFL